jgi:hypothetical protein
MTRLYKSGAQKYAKGKKARKNEERQQTNQIKKTYKERNGVSNRMQERYME